MKFQQNESMLKEITVVAFCKGWITGKGQKGSFSDGENIHSDKDEAGRCIQFKTSTCMLKICASHYIHMYVFINKSF